MYKGLPLPVRLPHRSDGYGEWQIDRARCHSGCRLCVDACPSHAISLVPEAYPDQQEKTDGVKKALGLLSKSKTEQETMALEIEKAADNPLVRQWARAVGLSNRIMAEDLLREAGFMLPQSGEARNLLLRLSRTDSSPDFPREAVEKLIRMIDSGKW